MFGRTLLTVKIITLNVALHDSHLFPKLSRVWHVFGWRSSRIRAALQNVISGGYKQVLSTYIKYLKGSYDTERRYSKAIKWHWKAVMTNKVMRGIVHKLNEQPRVWYTPQRRHWSNNEWQKEDKVLSAKFVILPHMDCLGIETGLSC